MKMKFLLYSAVFLLVGGCYPDGPEYTEDLDLIYSNYREDFDFSSQKTYAIPDKIVKITGEITEGSGPEFIKEPQASQILAMIESEMQAYGWTKTDTASADMILFPASWTNTTVYYWYDYWCWWYTYYCGWGGYYGGANVVTYTTGTLVMTMVPNDPSYLEPPVVWVGGINGLLSYSYDQNRVSTAIGRAFEQSPYLNIK